MPHSKDTLVYIHDTDITGWSTQFEFGRTRTLAERTAFGHSGRRYVPGIAEPEWSFEGIFGADTGEPEPVMNALLNAASGQVISHYPAGDALGSAGYVGRNSHLRERVYPSRTAELVTVRASGRPDERVDDVVSLYAKPGSAITSDEVTSLYDRGSGADTTDLLVRLYLHVFSVSASGGNAQWVIDLEEGDNVATAVSGAQITVSSVGGKMVEVASTDLERYLRLNIQLDADSGSLLAQGSVHVMPN